MMRLHGIITIGLLLVAAGTLLGLIPKIEVLPLWLYWIIGIIALAVAINDALGKPVPFLRWSFLRMMFGMKSLLKNWQVGDGREANVEAAVLKRAVKGNPKSVMEVIDDFAYNNSLLINVGDRKGEILDHVVTKVNPRIAIELGAYVGYSATRIARLMPQDGHLYSVEFNADNAAIAMTITSHAGLSSKITFVVGSLGDGGNTADKLQQLGVSPGSVDLVFIDHAKEAYLTDLKLMLDRGWFHPGTVVVADNIKFPGAPDYAAYMHAEEGKHWKTISHASYVEYQTMIHDIVMESTFLG